MKPSPKLFGIVVALAGVATLFPSLAAVGHAPPITIIDPPTTPVPQAGLAAAGEQHPHSQSPSDKTVASDLKSDFAQNIAPDESASAAPYKHRPKKNHRHKDQQSHHHKPHKSKKHKKTHKHKHKHHRHSRITSAANATNVSDAGDINEASNLSNATNASDPSDVADSTATSDRNHAHTSTPLNLNHATLAQIAALPGMTAQLAHNLIVLRDLSGGFDSLTDLQDVDGMTPKKLTTLAPHITL